MQERYKIGAVYEKDAKTPKESAQHVIGRTGILTLLQENAPMYLDYDTEELKGYCLRTSFVEMFEENDNGIWVYTENSVYRLDKI
jgi:hypothetical protein